MPAYDFILLFKYSLICFNDFSCLKKFKNSLEKKIYQGRGSSICHVATEHGRLLRALINEGGLAEEIEFLAQHDKSFNDAYNEYFGKIFYNLNLISQKFVLMR